MNPKIRELVEKLQGKLVDYQEKTDRLQREINNLKNQSLTNGELEQKDKELDELRIKLQTCQTERNDLSSQMGEKITELNNSNLENSEKHKQIAELMAIDYSKLKVSCSILTKTLNGWIEAKEKVNELLKIKEERSREAVLSLEKTKRRQWIIVGVLLVLVVLLSLSCFYQQVSEKK